MPHPEKKLGDIYISSWFSGIQGTIQAGKDDKEKEEKDLVAQQNMYAQLLPLALPAPPGMGIPPPPMGAMGMPLMGGMGMPPMPAYGMPPMGSY
ncbi:hypothetical protein GUJ93_ZPchr0012g19370 [Zizania palustris]|uniref:Clathrin heavy chain n=1 Tax=Zizania palustris TaxID=103762 RepID=A0A8J5WQ40_ZIZPA|nr:hypothetical protein GUJ93_ZPchr0012g19370 [Zizania palustris]